MSSKVSDRPSSWWGRLTSQVKGWFSSLDFGLNLEPLVFEDAWNERARLGVAMTPGLLAQFRARQPFLSNEEVDLVVEALRQWVRIEGRYPGHVLPSRAAYDLEQYFPGRSEARPRGEAPLMFIPDPAAPRHFGNPPSTRAAELLQSAFLDAFLDEGPSDLPLLFRLDEEVGWPDGLSYRSTCAKLPCQTIDADGRICVHMRNEDLGRSLPWVPPMQGGAF